MKLMQNLRFSFSFCMKSFFKSSTKIINNINKKNNNYCNKFKKTKDNNLKYLVPWGNWIEWFVLCWVIDAVKERRVTGGRHSVGGRDSLRLTSSCWTLNLSCLYRSKTSLQSARLVLSSARSFRFWSSLLRNIVIFIWSLQVTEVKLVSSILVVNNWSDVKLSQ